MNNSYIHSISLPTCEHYISRDTFVYPVSYHSNIFDISMLPSVISTSVYNLVRNSLIQKKFPVVQTRHPWYMHICNMFYETAYPVAGIGFISLNSHEKYVGFFVRSHTIEFSDRTNLTVR